MFIFLYSTSTASSAYEWTIYTNWTPQFGAQLQAAGFAQEVIPPHSEVYQHRSTWQTCYCGCFSCRFCCLNSYKGTWLAPP